MDEDTARGLIEAHLDDLDGHWEITNLEAEALIPHPADSYVFEAQRMFSYTGPVRGVMNPMGDIEFDA